MDSIYVLSSLELELLVSDIISEQDEECVTRSISQIGNSEFVSKLIVCTKGVNTTALTKISCDIKIVAQYKR